MTRLATKEIEKIEVLLQQASGLSFSKPLRKTIQTAFTKTAAALNLEEAQLFERLLAGEAKSIAGLVENSVVSETYFFRHPEQFAALQRRVVADFAGEPALKIWSAGCASGEESYSLAMALIDAGRGSAGDAILGTDISEPALRTAREAVYGRWSFRRVDPALRRRHFEPVDSERVRVCAAARSRVRFKAHNLIADPAPVSSCHVVFCRNVLIYFSAETAAQVLRKLAGALLPKGLLVLGPVETPHAALLALEWLETGGATLLRKPDPFGSPPPVRRTKHATPGRPLPLLSAKLAAGPAPKLVARPTPAAKQAPSLFELAREAARQGRLDEAERLALGSVAEEMSPESFLLLSMAAESRGDLKRAVEQARKALYLDSGLATGHAFLVALYQRLGQAKEAERARRNALLALEGVGESVILRGVEAMTAGALRRALERAGPRGWQEKEDS